MAGVVDGVGRSAPRAATVGVVGLGADEGAGVGDVVVEAVLLDLDDGADPCLVVTAVDGPAAQGPGNIVRRVLHAAVDVLAQPPLEDVFDLAEGDSVGVVGGEVAVAAVLAGEDVGDGLVEHVGLVLEVDEVLLPDEQVGVAELAFSAWPLAVLEPGDVVTYAFDRRFEFFAALRERGEVGCRAALR